MAAPITLTWMSAVRQPDLCLDWSTAQWELAVRQARRGRLLARLADAVDAAGLLEQVPATARRHLLAEQRVSRSRTAAMCWTMERVLSVLRDAPYPKILLKGAAYVAQQLPIAAGRLPSDLDIMVPKAHVPDAQRRLAEAGWCEAPLDAHDQQYYRDWSHEAPPMTHPGLQMELDLHHNILPPVGHVKVDAHRLLERLVPAGADGWQALAPVDQVLHSAAHLFFDSSFQYRARDLVDLDGLLRHFGRQPGFWAALEQRCDELQLAEPLALAVIFVVAWLETPVPTAFNDRLLRAGPSLLHRQVLTTLYARALTPPAPDESPETFHALAQTVLLMRYHWRRMPLKILVPHLWHKSIGRHRLGGVDPVQPPR